MSVKTRDQYLAVNKNRRFIYAFLSRMYEKEITIDLIKELISEKSPILKIRDVEELGDLREGFEMLSGYLKASDRRDLEEVKLELAVEYAGIFLGVRGKPLHPSESVYRGEGKLVMQKPRDEVLHAYRTAGVDKVKEYTEPEDHVAIELQFMAYLCRKTVEALEKNRKSDAKKYLEMQKKFIDDHLALWISQLTQDILESAKVDFYKGIANITKDFIEMERKAMNDLIEEIGDL